MNANIVKNDAIEQIARDLLDIETLKTRNSDRLDFHEVAVWQVRHALAVAFEAGQAYGKAEARAEK